MKTGEIKNERVICGCSFLRAHKVRHKMQLIMRIFVNQITSKIVYDCEEEHRTGERGRYMVGDFGIFMGAAFC